MKNLNKETRGILNGTYAFVGQIGILIFSLIGGWMFDSIGPKSPFVFIGVLDFTFAMIFLAFMCGQRGEEDDSSEENSDELEDQ